MILFAGRREREDLRTRQRKYGVNEMNELNTTSLSPNHIWSRFGCDRHLGKGCEKSWYTVHPEIILLLTVSDDRKGNVGRICENIIYRRSITAREAKCGASIGVLFWSYCSFSRNELRKLSASGRTRNMKRSLSDLARTILRGTYFFAISASSSTLDL